MLGAEPLVQAMVTVPLLSASAAAFNETGSYVKLIPVVLMVQFATTVPVTVKGLDAVPARTSPDSAISAHNAAVRMRYTSAPLHSPSCGLSSRASTICQSKNAVKTYR